jgi:hypothetical protein
MTTFYLGTHEPSWLAKAGFPLFVSHRRLALRRSLPRAAAPWALDSGGFTELNLFGEWRTTPQEYVTAVRRYRDEIGLLDWASPQDWMNEPDVLKRTGLSVSEHQQRTVDNYLTLRELAPDLPFVPVLQGWLPADYLRCADLYDRAGVDLGSERVVGVGSVCRRQGTQQADLIFSVLSDRGIALHGFGVKLTGLRVYGHLLHSADSLAWSYRARRAGKQPSCSHGTCSSCLRFASAWRQQAIAELGKPRQLAFIGVA